MPRQLVLAPGFRANTDERGADHVALDEAEFVGERVRAWTREAMTQVRAASHGQTRYTELKARMSRAMNVPGANPSVPLAALVDGYQAGAEQYGRTGAAFVGGDVPKGAPVAQIVEAEGRLFDAFNLANDEASLTELPPPNSRGSAAIREKPRKPDALPIGQFVAAGTNLQAFADGRTQPHAVVMVEVFQADDGRVVAATVQRSSGVPALDGWAIHIAREAGSALDGAAADAGVSHPGKRYRSLWKLDARVSYRRKLRASELGGREVLAVASSLLLGLVTGQRAPTAGGFDETLGEVDVVDLTSPRYACSVELVEAD